MRKRTELPTFRFKNVLDYMFFVLVLSPKDGARARNRSICEFDYEHEHHFIEHEHEFKLKDVGNSERVSEGSVNSKNPSLTRRVRIKAQLQNSRVGLGKAVSILQKPAEISRAHRAVALDD